VKRNVSDNKVLRAIMSATAGMLTISTVAGSIPMQVFAEEVTDVKDENGEVIGNTTTVSLADAGVEGITDGAGDAIEVVADADVTTNYVVDGKEADAAKGTLEYTETVNTIADVETEYKLVDENGAAVSGTTEDGEVVEEIILETSDLSTEMIKVDAIQKTDENGNTITHELTEEEQANKKYGYFAENGDFVAIDEATASEEDKAKSAYYLKDEETGEYSNVTTVVSYTVADSDTSVFLDSDANDGVVENYQVEEVYSIGEGDDKIYFDEDALATDENGEKKTDANGNYLVELTSTVDSRELNEDVTIVVTPESNKLEKVVGNGVLNNAYYVRNTTINGEVYTVFEEYNGKGKLTHTYYVKTVEEEKKHGHGPTQYRYEVYKLKTTPAVTVTLNQGSSVNYDETTGVYTVVKDSTSYTVDE